MGILEEMDKRIADLEALVEALQKRLAEVEARRLQPVVIRDRTPEPKPSIPTTWPYSQPPVIWGESNPLINPPFKITCQIKEELCD